MCMMALIASNVKYVLNHLKRVGLLKDILLCIPKKNLLVISVEESFLQKTIWGCILKQNMNSKDVDFLRKKSEFHLLFQEDFVQGSRRVQCDVCFENFRDKYNLKRHYVVHTREKPYACSLCDGRFTQISSLKQHIKTKHVHGFPMVEHKWTQNTIPTFQDNFVQATGRHQCEICFKGFRDKYVLKRHYVVHTKEKPYVCEICNRGFSQHDTMKIHIRTIHQNTYPKPVQ